MLLPFKTIHFSSVLFKIQDFYGQMHNDSAGKSLTVKSEFFKFSSQVGKEKMEYVRQLVFTCVHGHTKETESALHVCVCVV